MKHNLDREIYAIKRVQLSHEAHTDRVLREVTTLSRMSRSSERVVRYYQAWTDWGNASSEPSMLLHGDSLFGGAGISASSTCTTSFSEASGECKKIEPAPCVCSLCGGSDSNGAMTLALTLT